MFQALGVEHLAAASEVNHVLDGVEVGLVAPSLTGLSEPLLSLRVSQDALD